MTAEHVPVDFAETGVRPPADEPAPVRRLRRVECRRPRHEVCGKIADNVSAGLRIPTGPSAVVVPMEPGTRTANFGDEPVHLARGNVAVKRPGIGQNCRPHGLPIATCQDGVLSGSRNVRNP